MPMRIGLIAYPAFIMMMQVAKPSAVPAFEKARAFDADSARRPQSLEVRQKAVRKAVNKGLLVAAGNGRYYLDRAKVKKSDRTHLAIMGLVLLTAIPAAYFLL
ncbi:MAG: hypothetical protein KDA20_08390 [Phycisphaerales bacterium]|nr:hypothetical protein [Phycisphaerales bacterium]